MQYGCVCLLPGDPLLDIIWAFVSNHFLRGFPLDIHSYVLFAVESLRGLRVELCVLSTKGSLHDVKQTPHPSVPGWHAAYCAPRNIGRVVLRSLLAPFLRLAGSSARIFTQLLKP